jgi:hypothetical protein
MSVSTEGAARLFVASITEWGQTQSTFFFLDLVICCQCYYAARPNQAILLLLIASALKAINIVPFYFAGMYTPSFSDFSVNAITVTLEIGWFFYDHIISASTLHRVLIFYGDAPKLRKAFMGMFGFSVLFGGVFRILRNTCRFGTCAVANSATIDSVIASNVLSCEFILLGALLYKCILYRKETQQGEDFFGVFIQEAYMRLIIGVPLGIMEAIAYMMERVDNAPTSFVWFLAVGIYARQLAPTMLAMAILSTKSAQQTKMSSSKLSYKTNTFQHHSQHTAV